MADSAADLARRIAEMERKIGSLARASQISRSTVHVEGTDVLVPEAIGEGVRAGVEVGQVREQLEQARIELDAAMVALEENLEQAEQLIAGAESRLSDAESQITDAFGQIATVQTDVDTAITSASAAQSTADNLPKVLHGTTAASGTAPDGSIWFQHDGALSGSVVGQWNRVSGSWVSTPISSEAIANLDVGKLTAGSAAIADLVAQKIAAASGQFLELDVGQLTASSAVLDEAVANKVWSDSTVTRLLTAEDIIGGNAIFDGTVTADKLVMNEAFADAFWANEGNFGRINTENLEVGEFGVNLAPPLASGNGWTAGGSTLTYLNDGESGQHVRIVAGPGAPVLASGLTRTHPLPLVLSDRGSAFKVSFDLRYLSGAVPADPAVEIVLEIKYDTGETDRHNWVRSLVGSTPTNWLSFTVGDVFVPSTGGRQIESLYAHIVPAAPSGWSIEIRNYELRRSYADTFIDNNGMATEVMSAARYRGHRLTLSGQAQVQSLIAEWIRTTGDMNVAGDIRTTSRIGMSDGIGVNPSYTYIGLAEWQRLKAQAVDTGWINIPTSALASGFTTPGDAGQLQYRIKSGVCYWRGGVHGSLPNGAYTRVLTGFAPAARPTSLVRAGGGSSSGNPIFAEISPEGNINIANASGGTRAWAAFNAAYPI